MRLVVINKASTPQMALPFAHSDKASFENYWVGTNRELVTALRAAVQNGDPKVLYLYGPSGAGKSHLLFAAMRLAKKELIKTSYVSLADQHVNTDMLAILDVANLVFVDNIQVWAGDEDKERALFTLFEQVKHAGGQLILASDQPPETNGFTIRDLILLKNSNLMRLRCARVNAVC